MRSLLSDCHSCYYLAQKSDILIGLNVLDDLLYPPKQYANMNLILQRYVFDDFTLFNFENVLARAHFENNLKRHCFAAIKLHCEWRGISLMVLRVARAKCAGT